MSVLMGHLPICCLSVTISPLSTWTVVTDGLEPEAFLLYSKRDRILCQQRALEGHCRRKGASSWFLCAGFGFFLLLLHAASAAWVCSHIQLCSAQPFSDLSAPVQAWRPPFHGPPSRGTKCSRLLAHSGIQIPVCTHVTALILPVPQRALSCLPRNCASAWV